MKTNLVRNAALLAMAMGGGFELAHAQSSASFSLLPGVPVSGGSGSSTNFRLVGEAGGRTGRASSATRDLIGGFVGGAFSSQANVTLSTAAGTFASIGVAVRAPNTAPTSIFDELGAVNNTAWRLGHFSAPANAYQEAGGALTAVTPGQGYWLITAGATASVATGLPVPNADQVFTLENGPASAPGFNQMANPFLYPITVGSLRVSDGVNPSVQLTNAGNTRTERNVRIWNGTGYTTLSNNTDVINGRTAFWVQKLVAGTAQLIVNPVPSTTGSPVPTLAKPTEATWAVAIQPTHGTAAAEPLMFGAAAVPEGEWNGLNLARAPSPPGRHLAAYVQKTGWGRMSGEYVREFKPAAESMEWDFVVENGEAPGQMALGVSAFDLPAGARLWLTDERSGERVEVAPGEALPFAAVEGARRFRLAVTAAGIAAAAPPIEQKLRFAYPNPFKGSIGLAFAMAAPGEIRVEIFDAQGRRIRRLERLADSPGETVVVWDGLDAGGRRVGNGVYLARYQAGDVRGVRRLVRME
jgi:hypothetical protein